MITGGWATVVSKCHTCDRTTRLNRDEMIKAGWEAVHIRRDGAWLQTQYCPRHARWWKFAYWARRYSWRIGRISSWFDPGYSACGRCRTTWSYVESHVTSYSDSYGCFPLCEKCWRELLPVERLPYYRELHSDGEWDVLDWEKMERAVLTEESMVEQVRALRKRAGR